MKDLRETRNSHSSLRYSYRGMCHFLHRRSRYLEFSLHLENENTEIVEQAPEATWNFSLRSTPAKRNTATKPAGIDGLRLPRPGILWGKHNLTVTNFLERNSWEIAAWPGCSWNVRRKWGRPANFLGGSAACTAFVHLSIGTGRIFCPLVLFTPLFARPKNRDKDCQVWVCLELEWDHSLGRHNPSKQLILLSFTVSTGGWPQVWAPEQSPVCFQSQT